MQNNYSSKITTETGDFPGKRITILPSESTNYNCSIFVHRSISGIWQAARHSYYLSWLHGRLQTNTIEIWSNDGFLYQKGLMHTIAFYRESVTDCCPSYLAHDMPALAVTAVCHCWVHEMLFCNLSLTCFVPKASEKQFGSLVIVNNKAILEAY